MFTKVEGEDPTIQYPLVFKDTSGISCIKGTNIPCEILDIESSSSLLNATFYIQTTVEFNNGKDKMVFQSPVVDFKITCGNASLPISTINKFQLTFDQN